MTGKARPASSHAYSGGSAGADGTSLKRPEKNGKDLLQILEEWMKQSRFLGDGLKLPPEAAPSLAGLMEKEGMSREEAGLLIERSSDSDGFLHLDRLLRLLKGRGGLKDHSQNELVVRSQHIPRVEEALFKAGLGVGEVKGMAEKAVNRQGDMVLGSLKEDLGDIFQGVDSEKAIAALLSKFGITSQGSGWDQQSNQQALKAALKGLETQPPHDLQQAVKQRLAGLLREKGIPPQEVKRLLETLSVDGTRSSERPLNQGAAGAGSSDVEKILDQVRVTPANTLKNEEEKEKILSSLKRDPLEGKGLKEGTSPSTNGTLQKTVMIKLEQDRTAGVSALKMRDGASPEVGLEGRKPVDEAGGLKLKGVLLNPLENDTSSARGDRITGSSTLAESKTPAPLPDPLPKILDRMIWMTSAGQEKSRIQLSPPELGKLDVNLMLDHGHLRAHIAAESLWVKGIIDSNVAQLKQHLSAMGFVVDQFDVMVGLGNPSE